MDRKRGLIISCLVLVIILSVSFVSAGFFSDLWSKITGKVVADCSDTDLGDINNKGVTCLNENCYNDFCIDTSTIDEGYCKDASGNYVYASSEGGFAEYTCPSGFVCSNGACQAPCVPKTCSELGYECGSVSDSCGGTLSCGSCDSGYVCSSGTCVSEASECISGYTLCVDPNTGLNYCYAGSSCPLANPTGIVLNLTDVYNHTVSFIGDRVRFTANSGETYEATIISEGKGIISINGLSLNLSYTSLGKPYVVISTGWHTYLHETVSLSQFVSVIEIGTVLQLYDVYNQTTGTGAITNDRIKFMDVVTNERYETTFTSIEGSGIVYIAGKGYIVNFTGTGEDAIVKFNDRPDLEFSYKYGGNSLISLSELEKEPARCTDSDEGKDYYTKGVTKGTFVLDDGTVYEDYIGTDWCPVAGGTFKYVEEYFCDNEKVSTEMYECTNSCYDGACVDFIRTTECSTGTNKNVVMSVSYDEKGKRTEEEVIEFCEHFCSEGECKCYVKGTEVYSFNLDYCCNGYEEEVNMKAGSCRWRLFNKGDACGKGGFFGKYYGKDTKYVCKGEECDNNHICELGETSACDDCNFDSGWSCDHDWKCESGEPGTKPRMCDDCVNRLMNITLTSDNPVSNIVLAKTNTLELVSASDTSAVIWVMSSSYTSSEGYGYEQKEINELETGVISGVEVGVMAADEDFSLLSADIIAGKAITLRSDNNLSSSFDTVIEIGTDEDSIIRVGEVWTVELMSATDSSATIKVTDSEGVSETKVINEGEIGIINNIDVGVIGANEEVIYYAASIIIGKAAMFRSDKAGGLTSIQQTIGPSYTLELVSASDTSAVIKVTDSTGVSEQKEVNEREDLYTNINGLYLGVTEADETEYLFSATITTPNIIISAS